MKTSNTNHHSQIAYRRWLLYFIILPGILAISFGMSLAQGPCNSLTNLTFANDGSGNTLSSGDIITNQLRAAYGIDVRAINPYNNSNQADLAMIFDSSNPTGGDVDLGTPNSFFNNGPGQGSGGVPSNNQPLGNLLIISEDGSQSDPDDEADGGELRLDFAVATYVSTMTLVDLDNNGNRIKVFYNNGQVRTIQLPNRGDNSVHVETINQTNVNQIRLILCGSGALAGMEFCDAVTCPTVAIGGPDSVCYGATAAISAQVTDGIPPFTYAWSNSATSPSITVGGGNYTVTVTDSLGATATASHTIVAPSQPVAVGGSTSSYNGNVEVSCSGAQDGWINSGANGGYGNYTYLWSNNATTANISNLGAGTYSVTVTDQFGCQCGGSWTLTAPSPIQLSFSNTDADCFGSATGSASVQVSGGSQPYSYAWSNNSSTSSANNLTAGSYSVTVTDQNNCQKVGTVSVGQATNITANLTPADATCFGSANGSINCQVGGGTQPYGYSWSNGSTSANPVNLVAGSYTVTITDAKGCQLVQSTTVGEPTSGLNVVPVVSSPTCNGASNGSITAQVSGGVGPYTYLWNDNSTASSLNNIGAGSYSVMVWDLNECQMVVNVTVQDPTLLTANLNPTDAACKGSATGNISCQTSGGTQPYTYLWSNGPTVASPGNLIAGSYTVTITDANGCTFTQSASVGEPASAISATYTSTDVSCNGGTNGSINVQASGGTGSYTYLWSNNSTSASLSNVTAGNYSLTITDQNGCQSTVATTVQEPTAISANLNPTNAACYGSNSGSIVCQTSGGIQPYDYLWSNGATVANPGNLQAGTYSVTITDANGCTFNQSATVGQPGSALSASPVITHASCNGSANGSVALQINGGTSPYNVVWNNNASTLTGVTAGTYTAVITDQNGCQTTVVAVVQEPGTMTATLNATDVTCFGTATGTISCLTSGGTQPYTYLWSNGATVASPNNLIAGSYTVTITDSNGCSMNQSVMVGQPANALAGVPTVTNAACNGSSTGAINVQASGGVSPYRYLWNNNDTTSNLSNVPAGNYTLMIWDMNECQAIVNVTVGEPAAITAALSGNAVTCYGDSSGTLDCQVAGGVAPFTYSWSNGGNGSSLTNLTSGSFTVTVTDSNGCSMSVTGMVDQPAAALDLTVSTTDVLCFGEANGSILTQITGGTAPYSVSGTEGMVGASMNNLAAGNYPITVVDANGCEMSVNATILEPTAALDLNLMTTQPSCGQADGVINPQISGGTAPYTISVNGQTLEPSVLDLSQLSPGTYAVTVIDANNCETSSSATLEPANSIVIDASSMLPDCVGNGAGEINLTVSGTGSNLNFAWSNGSTAQNLNGLNSGTYSVTITDEAGSCEAVESFEIPMPLEIDPVVRRVTCPGMANGSVELNPSGGTEPYNVLWGNGFGGNSLHNLTGGHYGAQIVDALGCQSSFSTMIETMPVPKADAGRDITLDDCETSVQLTANVPDEDATGTWSALNSDLGIDFASSASTSVQNLGKDVDNMFVWTVDRDGCSASDTTNVRVFCSPCNPIAPELLTPNGDGANDVYLIGSLPPNSDLMIMNRWGNKVYEVNNYQNDWAGTNNQGQALPEGTYFVLLDYLCEGIDKKTLKGFVHIER